MKVQQFLITTKNKAHRVVYLVFLVAGTGVLCYCFVLRNRYIPPPCGARIFIRLRFSLRRKNPTAAESTSSLYHPQDVMSGFLFTITELDTLQLQLNPPLWNTTVNHVTVYADERLVFHFKNGSEVEVRV